jgi:hypothetical protein
MINCTLDCSDTKLKLNNFTVYVFKCKEVTTGRYVKVMIKGAEYLTLAEVQVFSPGMSEHSLLK